VDLFEEEIILFFKHLNEQKVSYILVGGIAVNYHGFSRATGDIDVWIDDSKANRENFVNALKNYGIEGAEVFYQLPFIARYTEIMLDNGMHIDLMSDMQFFKKENFKECFNISDDFDLAKNVKVKILHLNTLIEDKEKSSWPKDNLDADSLKKLYRL
jgi:hypothetical protein